ncbi:hypothetical protein AP1H75_12460 [Apilactobacillus apinorum]|uniref:hypothetical protein n=1 Tax=Apilactobacillus apinorum TaxID=1218495 RepID=UPI0030E7C83A
MTESSLLKQKIYLFSYTVLMIAAVLYVYSAFNSVNLVSKPFFIQIVWNTSVLFFIFSQMFLFFFYNSGHKRILSLLLICILLFFAIVFGKSLNLMIICLILLILNSNSVNFTIFIKFDFFIRLISLITLVLMFVFNIIPSVYNVYVLRGQELRSSFGFNHPNTFGGYYLYLLISLLFYISINVDNNKKYKSFNKYIYLFIFLSGFFIEFIYADSRSAQVAFVLILILLIPLSIKHDITPPKPIFGFLFFALIYCISLLFVFLYNPNSDFFYNLNLLTSNRLYLQNQAFNIYGFGIFNTSDFTQGRPIWVDNQYAFNLISMGLIGSAIYIYIYFKSIFNSYRIKSYLIYIVLIAIIVKGCFESTIIDYYAMMPIVASFMINNNQLEKERNLGG